MRTQKEKFLRVDRIIMETELEFALAPGSIASHSRKHTVLFARNMAVYLSRSLTGLSYENLGLMFNRNHGSIIAAERTIEHLILDGDTNTLHKLTNIRGRVYDEYECFDTF
jgi:chromosomal replication initiator protein